MIPYQYVVLRVVPRVDREEFVNVGIVVFADAIDYLDAAFHLDQGRLAALDPGLDLASVEASLQTICDVCRGLTGRGRQTYLLPGAGSVGLPLPEARSFSRGRGTAA